MLCCWKNVIKNSYRVLIPLKFIRYCSVKCERNTYLPARCRLLNPLCQNRKKNIFVSIIFSHNIFPHTGLFFRPASLYHPQRDAISHIKCQKEKVKGVNSKDKLKMKKKNQLLNFAFLKNRRLRLFLIAMSVLALGIYTPLFYVVSLTIITRFIGINCDHLHIVKLGLRSSSISSLREKADFGSVRSSMRANVCLS